MIRPAAKGFGTVGLLLCLLALSPDAMGLEARQAGLAGLRSDFEEPIELLMAPGELVTFRGLENPKTRQRFLDRFWSVRGPDQRDDWQRRLLLAESEFSNLRSDRARLFLVAGPPIFRLTDICPAPAAAHEVWHYAEDGSKTVVFVAPTPGAELEIWSPGDWPAILATVDPGQVPSSLAADCERGAELVAALEGLSLPSIELLGDEVGWVNDFLAETTLLPKDADRFEASLELEFLAAADGDTAVVMTFEVPGHETVTEPAPAGARSMLLTGEIFGAQAIDDFRFLYSGTVTGDRPLRLSARRHLAPGRYRMVVKLHDTARNSFFHSEQELNVPAVVNQQAGRQEPERRIFKLLPPPEGYLIGTQRFDTITSGSKITKVSFYLDGRLIMTKNRPPFSLELDLGEVPRPQEVEATGFDKDGIEIARDRISVNSGPHRFAIRVVNPLPGSAARPNMTVHAEVETPLGEDLSYVDLFWNERRMARLFQAPFVHSLDPPKAGGSAYLRAVAVLEDGHSAEDLVVLNTSDTVEAIDIDFVEIYASVVDADGDAVEGLERQSFRVFEDGVEQEVRRFETVDNLPINALVVLDSSESMVEEIEDAEQAAAKFFENVIEPKDRAAVMVFNDTPQLRVPLTNNLVLLENGLVGIQAGGETSLYDTVVYGLYYLAGLRGKRALVLLSDGADSVSHFSLTEALDYARRSGVAVYTIGLGMSNRDVEAQSVLRRLAHETGGASFSIANTRRLERIYDQIERELRSQYLIGYQSPQIESDDYRLVRLEVDGRGLSVKSVPGYYP